MSVRVRTTLMVVMLLSITVVTVTTVLQISTQQMLLRQAIEDGVLIARLLARSAAFARQVPQTAEKAVGDQMVVQARLLAELVASAEAQGQGGDRLIARLRRLIGETVLAEVWVTDAQGHAYLHTAPGIDFTFSPDAVKQPQAAAFWPLLSGKTKQVVQEARRREVDDQVFKYVGVPGVDHPRIVQVGCVAKTIQSLREELGLPRLANELVSDGSVISLQVINERQATLAYSAVQGVSPEKLRGKADERYLQRVMTSGEPFAYRVGDNLKVMAPVVDPQQKTVGATMVLLSLHNTRVALSLALQSAAVVALLILCVAAYASWLLTGSVVSQPLARLTQAASDVERGDYETDQLQAVSGRPDELGQLARTFGRMAQQVESREQNLRQAKLDTIQRLVLAAEYKDQDTAAHIQRMSHFSAMLARHVGLPADEIEMILQASPMHDVGKLGIPDAVLLKPGKLDDEEWKIMKSHTLIGANILQGSPSELLQAGAQIALAHHERWDGTGYPYGLRGEDIPLWGRICAVADVFDALTSERPYKPAFSNEEAMRMMLENRDRHFEARLVDLFFEHLAEAEAIQKTHGEDALAAIIRRA